jgi:hypothetical protein
MYEAQSCAIMPARHSISLSFSLSLSLSLSLCACVIPLDGVPLDHSVHTCVFAQLASGRFAVIAIAYRRHLV